MKQIINYFLVSLIMLTGSAKAYDAGFRSFKWNFIFRLWHPLTWLLYIIMIIPCAFMGEKIGYVVPVKLNKFYLNKHKEKQLIWGSWWVVMKDI